MYEYVVGGHRRRKHPFIVWTWGRSLTPVVVDSRIPTSWTVRHQCVSHPRPSSSPGPEVLRHAFNIGPASRSDYFQQLAEPIAVAYKARFAPQHLGLDVSLEGQHACGGGQRAFSEWSRRLG